MKRKLLMSTAVAAAAVVLTPSMAQARVSGVYMVSYTSDCRAGMEIKEINGSFYSSYYTTLITQTHPGTRPRSGNASNCRAKFLIRYVTASEPTVTKTFYRYMDVSGSKTGADVALSSSGFRLKGYSEFYVCKAACSEPVRISFS
ncbi:hypothetical protein GCM10022415_07840 [Knoellia locipacati]|uniref:Spore-associated protein A n=1 Tax=Knoellia locipacati TaxID=882824 RepID=A0A512SXU2_9MICO|nr:hypothetical protein [Knoellia locipacati]GEQ12735.1 hypothetical protein KLO01_07820 [Knoellia locipacati]